MKETDKFILTKDIVITEEDQQKLDKLNSQLERTGNFGQQKLYQSLSKVDTYNQTINAQKLELQGYSRNALQEYKETAKARDQKYSSLKTY